jgi:hypothetical protein
MCTQKAIVRHCQASKSAILSNNVYLIRMRTCCRPSAYVNFHSNKYYCSYFLTLVPVFRNNT